jgi:hypothetical protein
LTAVAEAVDLESEGEEVTDDEVFLERHERALMQMLQEQSELLFTKK